MTFRFLLAFPVLAFALALGGCAARNHEKLQLAVNSLDSAVLEGRKTPETSLNAYEALYKKYPKDSTAVGAYIDALRRVGQARKAADIARPYVEKQNIVTIPDEIFLAYTRLLLDQGFNAEAEKRLRVRLTLPASKMTGPASNAQISNLLGVALASQGRTTEAEQAFNTALTHWDGRPGVVEKNLAQLHAKQ